VLTQFAGGVFKDAKGTKMGLRVALNCQLARTAVKEIVMIKANVPAVQGNAAAPQYYKTSEGKKGKGCMGPPRASWCM